MENIEQNELEEKKIDSQNPKLQVVKSKNQIDFFMRNYAVNGDESHYYELTKEEIEDDEFRAVANAIRKEPQKFADRELV